MIKQLPSLTLVRRIKASPAKVFAALTQPEQMVQWWGPDAGPTLVRRRTCGREVASTSSSS